MVVEIYSTLCGGINKENLIEATCFYLKMILFHMFCSSFSGVRMFCDEDRSKLVTESTQPRVFLS